MHHAIGKFIMIKLTHIFAINAIFLASLQVSPVHHGKFTQYLPSWQTSASIQVLSRNFLVHENPRFLRITGVTLKEQLGSGTMVDHELMSVILHRYCQANQEAYEESPYLTWRHPLEPDFSTLVLSDFDYVHTVSIQNQLAASALKYDITSAQLFFTPVPCPEGWMVIFWDMVTRLMTVIDPLYTKKCPHPPPSNGTRSYHGSYIMPYSIA